MLHAPKDVDVEGLAPGINPLPRLAREANAGIVHEHGDLAIERSVRRASRGWGGSCHSYAIDGGDWHRTRHVGITSRKGSFPACDREAAALGHVDEDMVLHAIADAFLIDILSCMPDVVSLVHGAQFIRALEWASARSSS